MKIVREHINESLRDQNGNVYNNHNINGQNILVGKNGILSKDPIDWDIFKKIYILGKGKKYF